MFTVLKCSNLGEYLEAYLKLDVTLLADVFDTLRKNQPKTVHFSAIRSFKHKLYTVDTEKIALSAFDDKRYILDDSITSLAYRDYRIAGWDSKQKLSK